jgi:hypothetical protein
MVAVSDDGSRGSIAVYFVHDDDGGGAGGGGGGDIDVDVEPDGVIVVPLAELDTYAPEQVSPSSGVQISDRSSSVPCGRCPKINSVVSFSDTSQCNGR